MKILTTTITKGDIRVVELAATIGRGFAGISLLGPHADVARHGLERAANMVEEAGYDLPLKKILLAWTPSDAILAGTQVDLALVAVLGFLAIQDRGNQDVLGTVFVGEVALDGRLKAIRQPLSHVVRAAEAGAKRIVTDPHSATVVNRLLRLNRELEARIEVVAVASVRDLLAWLEGNDSVLLRPNDLLGPVPGQNSSHASRVENGGLLAEAGDDPNFGDMFLTPNLYLAAMVATVGRHHLLMRGTPGTGKTMFAERLAWLLGFASTEEIFSALTLHGMISEKLPLSLLQGNGPFRSPHHGASSPAILGSCELPGEVTLAHGGILFLDELPEFRRDVIEGLREPLESGQVRVARAGARREWPAKAMIVAAANNCPCGWAGSGQQRCKCANNRVAVYQDRISGPIEERFDLHLNFHSLSQAGEQRLYDPQQMEAQVRQAQSQAVERNKNYGCLYNRELPGRSFPEVLGLNQKQLQAIMPLPLTENLTQRAYFRGLKVARSLADLAGEPQVAAEHLQQAFLWSARQAAIGRGDILPD